MFCAYYPRQQTLSYTDKCCFYAGAAIMVVDVTCTAVVETGRAQILDWAKSGNSYPNA